MSDSILQVNQIKDKGGNATGITVADSTANISIGTTLAVNTINEVTSANGVTVDGLSLKDGNVVPASGKGIDFSAASGSASGSSGALLDDYEEGSVANPLELGGNTVTGGYASNYARYIKVGNAVTYSFFIDTSNNTTTGGTTGAVKVHLPFIILATSGRMAHHVTNYISSGWVTDHMWYAEANQTKLALVNTGQVGVSRSSANERFWLAHTFSYITS